MKSLFVYCGLALASFSSLANAQNIQRKIDLCQSSGGGACVFNILREIAGGGQPGQPPQDIFVGNYVKQSGVCSLTSATVYERMAGGRRLAIVVDWNRDPRQRYVYQCDQAGRCVDQNTTVDLVANYLNYRGNVACSYIKQ